MKAVHRVFSDDRASSLLELIGGARNVLVIGNGGEELLRALDAGGYIVSCALIGADNPDEARVFCSDVIALARDATQVPREFREKRFGAILFDGALERLTNRDAVLSDARRLLDPDGRVVASIRNALHGSVRLAVIAGKGLDGNHPDGAIAPLGARAVDELFATAGLVVTRVEYDRQPLFGEKANALGIKRSDFSRPLVDEIERDPRSEVYQFLVQAQAAGAGSAVSIPIGEVPPAVPVSEPSNIGAEDRAVAELQLELEGERATRDRLMAALADLTATNATLQSRIAELAQRRLSNASVLGAGRGELDALHAQLEAVKEERLRLKLALSLSFVALKRSGQELKLAESAWYALYDEMDELRERAESKEVNYRHHIAALESRVGDLESETLWKEQQLDEAASYSTRLEDELEAIRRASLAETAVMRQYADDVRERSEHLESTLRAQMAALAEHEREMRERVADLERGLGDENRELRQRVAEAEHTLAAQTDALITSMQTESAHLSQLVDTVQSSRFWRFKRWLNRLRGAFRS